MVRIIAKKVCIFTVMLSICIMQMTTAFAYDRICYMTEEEG